MYDHVMLTNDVLLLHVHMHEQSGAVNHVKCSTVASTCRSLSSLALVTRSWRAGPLRQKDTLTEEGMYRGRLNVVSMTSGRCCSSPGHVSSTKGWAAYNAEYTGVSC